jgi:hypothetical protein
LTNVFIVRTALFLSASGARGGFLVGATCTGLGPRSRTAAFLFGLLGANCTLFFSGSTTFAVGGTPGYGQGGSGDKAGDAKPSQYFFQFLSIHNGSPPFFCNQYKGSQFKIKQKISVLNL